MTNRIASWAIMLQVSLALTGSLQAQNPVTLFVSAKMDLFRAGGYDDGSDGIAPLVFSFPAAAGRIMTFPSVGGAWSCSPSVPEFGADGTLTGCFQPGGQNINDPGGPFSGSHLTDFEGALAGVFLEDTLPGSPPPALRFYVNDASEGGTQTDFKALSPLIGQVFFIGDGLTNTGIGSVQSFRVPSSATHLYLGYIDSCNGGPIPGCYSDNRGTLFAVVQLTDYQLNWVAPTLSPAPSARADVALTYDAASNNTLVFGGDNARLPGVMYGDTWVWRGAWTQLSPVDSPSPRGAAGMAYDPTTGTVVLFGGTDPNGIVFGDTWTWDGVNWTQQFPPASPPARTAIDSMAYDPISQTVVLFGGFASSTGDYGAPPFGDTWVWNGRAKTWTQKFPRSSPSPRGASIAYDATTKNVVLFGGNNGGGDCCRIYYGDTWTWDGSNWTQQFPAISPSPRTGQSMAYDAGSGKVIVFGGTSGPPEGLNDTWAWDGNTWKQLRSTQPTGLWGTSMDFDALTGGLVLFGGELSGDAVTNTTWLFVPVPIP